MNRFLWLTAGLSFFSLAAEAQLVKGTKLLGGSVGYSRSTSTQTQNNPSIPVTEREQVNRSFNVSPRVGAFVADNLAAGISVGYSSQKVTAPYYDYSSTGYSTVYQQTARNNSFNVAPFLRYYYMPTATFGVFGQLNATYSTGKSKTEITASNQMGNENEGKNNGFGLGISPALVFFPMDNLGLELAFGGIGYSRTTSKSEATRNQPELKSTYSDFGANFGFNQLSLGASYYLGR